VRLKEGPSDASLRSAAAAAAAAVEAKTVQLGITAEWKDGVLHASHLMTEE